MAPTEVWLITGAFRGVGAEIVVQVLQLKYTVVMAGARSPEKSQALQDLKQQHPERLHLWCLDVASDASIHGILEGDFEGKCSECACYDSNVKVLQSGNKKTVINLSSASGSLSTCHAEFLRRRENPSKFLSARLSYKASKAAHNMLTLSWASHVTPDDGFLSVAIHPGSVSTDMTASAFGDWGLDKKFYDIRLTFAQSVQKLLAAIANLTPSNSGQFLNTDGHIFPW